MRNQVIRLSLVVVLALCAGLSAIGQTITGDISGTVTDPSGAVVAGAKVTATNIATNVATSATTNHDGVYSIRFLQIGTYKVSVTSKGFTTLETAPFLLEVAQVAKVDAKLKLGSEASVQVNSQLAPILNTENGTISTNIPATLINDLPVNGHSFMELAQFAPGVSVGDQNQWNGATGSPNNSGERPQSYATLPNINGNRTYNNNYYIDGIENTDSGADLANGFGEPIYDPDPDSLESVNIFTSSAPAEFGNATAGQIVSILKSGTKEFHGSASGYLQNYLLDANTFGNKRNYNVVSPSGTIGTINPRGPYTQTIYSGTFGGPVRIPKVFNGKDKLFFFADYQGYFEPSAGVSQTNVALNAWRGNTTSSDPNDPSVSPLAGYAYFGNDLGNGLQLYDSQNNFAPFNQTINGTLYKNLVPIKNPVATYVFAHPNLYPLANTPITGLVQNGYSGVVKALTENNQFDVKMDYSPTDNDRISGSFSYSNAHDGQSQFLTPVSFPTLSFFPYKALRLNYVRTFTPSVVNEFRVGLTRTHYNQQAATNASFGTNGDSVVGINFPNQTVSGFTLQSIGGESATDVSQFGTSSAFNTAAENTFQYEDNLTILRGHHTFKVGAQLIRYQDNYFSGAAYGGALGTQNYSGLFTGDPAAGSPGYDFADFVLGYVGSLSVSQSIGDVGEREYRSAVFAQDDWKITPTLTLNLGLRYQYTQPVYEVHNKISNINLATGAIVLAGQDGNSRSLYSPVHNEFNPRLGFAWQERPRLVIRGGLGITTFMDFNALSHTGNFPFTAKVNQSAVNPTTTSSGTPFLTANGFPVATGTNTNYTAWTNLKPQFETQYDLAGEYELSNTSSLTLAYVGNFANRLLDLRNPNQWTLIGTPSSAPYFSTLGQGPVALYESEGASNFNAAEVSYRQRPTQGLELIVNYTYSKNLADTTGPKTINDISGTTNYPEDSYDLHREYGPVGSDQRHQFNGIANYALPFGNGKRFFPGVNRAVDEVIGGWKVSASSVLLGGFPLAVRAGSTGNILGGGPGYIRAHQYRKMKIVGRKYGYTIGTGPNSAGIVGNYANNFPNNEVLAGAFGTDPSATHSNYIGPGTCNNSAQQKDDGYCAYGIPFVLTEAKGQAPNFDDTVRIGTERAPAFRGVDGTLSKDFRIYEKNTLQFRCNAYNLGNITSYNNPNVVINSTSNNWGIVQSTRSQQRTLELQLTYKF